MKAYHYLKYFLLLSLFLGLCNAGFSQNYTLRDQQEIAYQARLTISMFKDMLNVISYKDLLSEPEMKELIKNSYTDSRSQLFYAPTAIIEDNLDPSRQSSLHVQDKSIRDYLQQFDLVYEKTEGPSVYFFDFQTSNLKYTDHLFIKVKYTCLFEGKHKGNPSPYTVVDLLAELRVEKRNNKWKTYITSIVYYKGKQGIGSTEHDVPLVNPASANSAYAHSGQNSKNSAAYTINQKQTDEFLAKKKVQDSLFNYHLETGKSALAAAKLEDAYAAFAQAENVYPFHQDLWQNIKELTKAQNLKINNVDAKVEYITLNAQRAFMNRDYVQAKSIYLEALQLKPEDAALKQMVDRLKQIILTMAIAESKYAVAEYKEALKDYNEGIKQEQNLADYYYGRGKCHEMLEADKKALKDYSKALDLDANYSAALLSRARLYTAMEQYHEAVADYTLLMSDPQYASAYYAERARVKKIIGDLNGAIGDYNAIIQQNPELADHYFEKGMILFKQQKLEEALNAFSEAIQRNHQHAGAYFQRALVYISLKDLQAAAPDLDRARNLGLDASQLDIIHTIAYKYFTMAEESMKLKLYPQALDYYNQTLFIAPSSGKAWLKKGDVYFIQEAYDKAIICYDKAVAHDSLSFAYFKRGLAYQQTNKMQSAREDFIKYLPIGKQLVARAEEVKKNESPHSPFHANFVEDKAEALYALGQAQLASRAFEEASYNLSRALRFRKDYPEAYFALGSTFYALGNYKKAIKYMEKSIALGHSSPFVYYELGRAFVAKAKLRKAIVCFSKAIELNPHYDAAYIERALCHKNYKQYWVALDDISTAFSLNDALHQDAGILTQKGILELYLYKLPKASQSFDLALSLEENNGWALYGKACALAQDQQIEEALQVYRKAFQSRQINWSDIKNDSLIKSVSKQKEFKRLVKSYL